MTSAPTVAFSVGGNPAAKGRPRMAVIAGHATAYTPTKTRKYENLVRVNAEIAMNGKPPLEGPVRVFVRAVISPPKSWSKKKATAALAGVLRPTTRPDVDNYAKIVLDACNSVVYLDDSLITDLLVRKRYGDRPRIDVEVYEEDHAES